MCILYDKVQILKYLFLLEEDEKYGGDILLCIYWGKKYYGGYSDYLLVCVDFEIGKQGENQWLVMNGLCYYVVGVNY